MSSYKTSEQVISSLKHEIVELKEHILALERLNNDHIRIVQDIRAQYEAEIAQLKGSK